MDSMSSFPPFTKAYQLCADLDQDGDQEGSDILSNTTLPGQPLIPLQDAARLSQFLDREICSPDLEAFARHLWILSTQSNANINPLHRQGVMGRRIVITEEPRLHLVWIHDRIFIKPIPRYLLSHKFWDSFLNEKSERLGPHGDTIRRAAMGFIRTYCYLIQHESDFMIAQQEHLHLIPCGIKWADFCYFISNIQKIEDAEVSDRYHYGELRLSRLNIYAPVFLRKFQFEQVHGQYGDYFARFYGPILFVFAIWSTILSSMQVVLTADQVSSVHWVSIWSVSRWFSIASLIGITFISGLFVLLWLWMFSDEWIYALKALRRNRNLRIQSRC